MLKGKNLRIDIVKEIITKKTKLNIYNIFDSKQYVIYKECKNNRELVHDAMIGLHCINPILKYIPNFSYTFGLFGDRLVTEYIPESITFLDFLTGDRFNMGVYIDILIQLSLSIHMAQNQYLFMHYDLYPWNIMIKFYDTPIDIYYIIYTNGFRYIKITTKVVPIIIDYGKSKGIYNGKHYGFIKPYSFSTIHDILCILLSSMYCLINNRTLNSKELRTIFRLSTFFSNTKYTGYKKFVKARELKQFLHVYKKFSKMINTPKYELEEKTPIDFVNFLCGKFNRKLHYSIDFIFTMRQGTSRHVYNYMNSNSDNDRYNTYLRLIENIQNHNISSENSILAYKIFHRIIESISSMYPDIPLDVYKSIEKLNTEFEDINIDIISDLKTINFDINCFEDTDECDRLYEYYSDRENISQDILFIKQIIIDYLLCDSDIIMIDNISILRYIANKNTFLDMYNKIQIK